MLTKKLAISSDRNSDEAIAVVYLMKMKMEAGLNGLDQKGICCLCDFEDDGSVVLQAMACIRAVIVLLSSGTLASAQQLAVGAWATKVQVDVSTELGTLDVVPVSIPGFVYPVEEFFAKTSINMFRTAVGVKFGFKDATEFVQALRDFFGNTSATLTPQSSERVLDHEVHDLLSRMRRGPRSSRLTRLSNARTSKEMRRSEENDIVLEKDAMTVMV